MAILGDTSVTQLTSLNTITANGVLTSNHSLQVINDSSNNTNDALAYIRHRGSGDWALTIDKAAQNYGLYINQAGTNMLKVGSNGRFIVSETGISATTTITGQTILPSATTTYNLGSVSYKWANIYATTFNGNATTATSATTASKLGSSTIGSSTKGIYLSSGTATACSYDLGANIKAYTGSLSSGGWATLNGRANSPSIAIAYNNAQANWNSGTYSASLVYGCSDTRGLLDCAYSTPLVTFGGGCFTGSTDDNPQWYMKISGTSGTTYNLNNFAPSSHSHTVSGTASSVSNHTHTISGSSGTGSSHSHGLSGSFTSSAGSSHSHGVGTIATATGGAHTHSVTITSTTSTASVDGHTHSFSASSTSGTGSSHSHSIPTLTTGANSGTAVSVLTSVKTSGTIPSLTCESVTVPDFSFGETSSGSDIYQLVLSKPSSASNITNWSAGAMPTFNTGSAAPNSHTHSTSASTTGAESGHTHSVSVSGTTGSAGSHSHGPGTLAGTATSAGGHTHTMSGSTAAEASHTHSTTLSGSTGAESAHTHGVGTYATASNGGHSHSVSGTAS